MQNDRHSTPRPSGGQRNRVTHPSGHLVILAILLTPSAATAQDGGLPVAGFLLAFIVSTIGVALGWHLGARRAARWWHRLAATGDNPGPAPPVVTTLNNVPGLVFRCLPDTHWTMLFLSERCEQMTGYPAAQLLNNRTVSFDSLIHPDDRDKVREGWNRHLRRKAPWYELEYRLITRQGEVRCVWERGTETYDEAGNIRFIEGLIEDVTARRHTATLAHEQARVLRAIAAGRPMDTTLATIADFAMPPDSDALLAVAVFNDDTPRRLTTLHAPGMPPALDRMLSGAQPGELCPRPDKPRPGKRLIRAAREAGLTPLALLPIIAQQQQNPTMLMMLAPGRKQRQPGARENETLQAVGNLVRIAMERRHNNERMELAANALNQAAEAIILLDSRLHIISANQSFQRITGYSAGDLSPPHVGRFPATPAEGGSLRKLLRHLRQAQYWQGELVIKRRDGTTLPALGSVSQVRDAQGGEPGYVAVFSDISRLRSYEKQLDYLANYDPLTHLPNRSLLELRSRAALEAAATRDHVVGLLLVDLDHFKAVNDSLGQETGDRILLTIAQRLRAALRDRDTVARFDSDHFLVLADRCKDIEGPGIVARKLLATISRPIRVQDRELSLSASIGIAVFPHDARDYDGLLSRTEAALRGARQRGRNTYRFHAGEMNQNAMEQLELATGLRRALMRNELFLEYQPVVDLDRHCVTGLEALIRWRHPQLGVIAPGDFIPLAEETGLIEPIGDWVITAVCQQLQQWREQGLDQLRIALNLSARQLWQAGLIEHIRKTVVACELPPGSLELELTESMVMDDPVHSRKLLRDLVEMGISIALDDFGTGYSSLNHLKYFPFQRVKIDQSFIAGIPSDGDDSAIVHTIIAMASTLRLELVAEGIETMAQHEALRDAGCEQGQGFLYSTPVVAADVPEVIARLKSRDDLWSISPDSSGQKKGQRQIHP